MVFQVEKNQIVRLDQELLTTENVNSVVCSFSFSQDYDGLEKFAVFYRSQEQNRFVELTDGTCIIPWELLKEEGILYVGAYGIKNTAEIVEKRMTTNAVIIRVESSVSSSAAPDAAPSPDIWEQYRLEILANKAETQVFAQQAEHARLQAVQLAEQTALDAQTALEYGSKASLYSSLADAYRQEAQRIKDSTELFYDVESSRVGFRRADESQFTYTDDLTGPKGDKGDSGAVVALNPGLFGMYVNEAGHLILVHNDNDPAPPLSITAEGKLVYNIS